MDVRYLPGRRREVRVAGVPRGRHQFSQCRRGEMNGILRQMRIGDVALHALDGQLAGERAAAAVLDRVAQPAHRGGLADDAVVEQLAARLERRADPDGAVDREAFLVGGDEESDRSRMRGPRGDELLAGHHHRGQRGLHVGGAAAIQLAVTHVRFEGVRMPLLQRAGRHHIGVAGEADHRGCAAAPRPQVLHPRRAIAEWHRLDRKTDPRQSFGNHRLTTAVLRRDGIARDQVAGEREGGRGGFQNNA